MHAFGVPFQYDIELVCSKVKEREPPIGLAADVVDDADDRNAPATLVSMLDFREIPISFSSHSYLIRATKHIIVIAIILKQIQSSFKQMQMEKKEEEVMVVVVVVVVVVMEEEEGKDPATSVSLLERKVVVL